MAYAALGTRRATGTSSDNVNWTITFDQAALAVSSAIPYFEVYHTSVSGVPGSTFSRNVDVNNWDNGIYGDSNTDDPNQPLIMQPGQTLTFDYTYPSANPTPPVATIWLRYDESILASNV